MNIELKFDYYSRTIHIPDGYIHDLKQLQISFLEWMQHQPECIVNTPNNRFGYSYNEDDFLKYVNSVILRNSNEKAYFLSLLNKKNKKRLVIEF